MASAAAEAGDNAAATRLLLRKIAPTFNWLGLSYGRLNDNEGRLYSYEQGLRITQALEDRYGEAVFLNGLGATYDAQGDLDTALDYYQQALPLARETDNKDTEASALGNIAYLYSRKGEQATAIDYYEQALALHRANNSRASEGLVLNNLAITYGDLGQKDRAITHFEQALAISEEVGDVRLEASVLTNLGRTYDTLGKRETALEYFQASLKLSQRIGDTAGEAVTLNNIGLIYEAIGEDETALDYFQDSLQLAQSANLSFLQPTLLHNIGNTFMELGEDGPALEYMQQALAASRAIGNRQQEALTLINLGVFADRQGNSSAALDYFEQALPIHRSVGNRDGEAVTLNNLGSIYLDSNPALAFDYFEQALPLYQAVGNRNLEVITLSNLAVFYRNQGQIEQAIAEVSRAIALIEDLRTDISPGEMRSSYFSTVQDYYQFKIDLLMQSGQSEAAFETSEAARARLLIELLSEANVDIRQGVDPALIAREDALQTELRQLELQRIALRSSEHTAEQAATLDQQSDAVLQQIDQTLTEIRRLSPAYADTIKAQPLTLNQIQQQVLDEETVLIQYALGEDQSYVWLVGKDTFQSYTLPAADDIIEAAERFRSAVSTPTPTGRVRQAGDALVKLILPEQPDWLTGKRLLVSGDGILAELPFAALPLSDKDEYTPMLVEHEVLTQPSISSVAVLRQQFANRPESEPALAVLADPVYRSDDERVTGQSTAALPNVAQRNLRDLDLRSIQPLPYTRVEAEQILEIAADLKHTAAFDFEADHDWLTNPNLNEYSILHLATHGFINPVNPQLSGMVLSLVNPQGQLREDGFLRLHDIFNLQLSAELVVLSACQTGRGENISGEGIVGLSRGFMYAGAERVAVSLWNVDDEGTARLMTAFYKAMLDEGLSPAAAMRAAQRQQWEAGYIPNLWAAFTLQGEWQ
ncbi:MAG: tetratricopeptide repeat protein [Cyanobacteria bacterium J06648_16]